MKNFLIQSVAAYTKGLYIENLGNNFLIKQKQPTEVFCNKGVLKNVAKFTGVPESLF